MEVLVFPRKALLPVGYLTSPLQLLVFLFYVSVSVSYSPIVNKQTTQPTV